jgi:hypothetical protein
VIGINGEVKIKLYFLFQINVRYEKVKDDPMEEPPTDEMEMSAMDQGDIAHPDVIAFPLMAKVQEIELVGLSKGWYLVCGEAVRSDVVLEKDCLWARIFEAEESGGGVGELKRVEGSNGLNSNIQIRFSDAHKHHHGNRGSRGRAHRRHDVRRLRKDPQRQAEKDRQVRRRNLPSVDILKSCLRFQGNARSR